MDMKQKNSAGPHENDVSASSVRSPESASGTSSMQREKERFMIRRTVNGIPVAANDFPGLCTIGDDALRILLTARQRANREMASGVPGENQILH